MSGQITLVRGGWYGWTMWPGYGDEPYCSPIRVEALKPRRTGGGLFDLAFSNAAYASGVQDMTYKLRMLKREARYLLASVVDSDRAVCIEPLNLTWLKHHMAHADLPFEQFEAAGRDAADTDIAVWLDRRFARDRYVEP